MIINIMLVWGSVLVSVEQHEGSLADRTEKEHTSHGFLHTETEVKNTCSSLSLSLNSKDTITHILQSFGLINEEIPYYLSNFIFSCVVLGLLLQAFLHHDGKIHW